MIAKFEADDRIEQMNAQRRRMKQLEHKRRVEELLEARRAQFAADKERERAEREEAENLERLRMQIIEEERQRLLREHASKLLGYLPKVRQLLHHIHTLLATAIIIPVQSEKMLKTKDTRIARWESAC